MPVELSMFGLRGRLEEIRSIPKDSANEGGELFVPQRHYRVNEHGATRGDVGCQERH
jgi:hypothetical protein